MEQLILGGTPYSFEEIRKNNFQGVSDYELAVLTFCAEWLNDKKTFEIQTSGSTGEPKIITISRSQMIKSAEMTATALNLKPGYKSLICLNTTLIAGKMMLVRGFEIGMKMTIVAPSSNPLTDFSKESDFDFTALVPIQMENILLKTPEKKNMLNKMKAIIIGGANIKPGLEKEIQKIDAPVYHTFGMTETVSHIALRRLNGNERSQYFKILNEVKISQDQSGCLIIESPLSKDPIVTNDVIEVIDKFHFKWIGRIDNIINSGGIKIQPEKVEAEIQKILQQLNINIRFFICGMPDSELGEVATLFYEGEEFKNETIEEIKAWLKSVVSKYEVPKKFISVSIFPETASGKIDKMSVIKQK